MFSLIRRKRSESLSDLLRFRVFALNMGGGPRIFPGELNKWQWKRLHEKKAKEKEKKLLEYEKQLYEARIRSEIRSKLWGKPESDKSTINSGPKEHIKVLADRFMKVEGKDSWNVDDDAVKSDECSKLSRWGNGQSSLDDSSAIDVRKLFIENPNTVGDSRTVNFGSVNGNSLIRNRNFSAMSRGRFRRNGSSCDEDDSYLELKGDSVSPFDCKFPGKKEKVNSMNVNELIKNKGKGMSGRRRFFKSNSSIREEDLDLDFDFHVQRWRDVRKIGNSANLGNYDVTKRVHQRVDSLMDIEIIREDFRKRKERESIYSGKRFDECSISPLTLKALSAFRIVNMTRVQDAILSECLDGKDALVKAKTGKGKSIAFLLLAIETVLMAMNSHNFQRVPPVYVLILCPTRELVSQLAAESMALLKYHDGISVQTLFGSTHFNVDQQRLESEPCQILIATPRRLLDYIENKCDLILRLMALKMFIIDEVDILLYQEFMRDVEKLVDCLPPQRQSLLFSTTISKEIRLISKLVLKRDHSYIDTVGVRCIETHHKVKQSCLVASHELHFLLVHQLLKQHIAKTPEYKIIVFCSTGKITSLMYMLLREMKMNVREIHASKSQLLMTRVSDEFKDSKSLILVTSDVSIRGMNYPDLTLVVQVGIPTDKGRFEKAGREGKEGESVLLIAPWERYFLDELKDLPLELLPVPNLDSEVKLQVEDSMAKIDARVKEAAYHAWLGYYNSTKVTGQNQTTLAELANQFCRSIGLQKPPPLVRRL